MRLIYSFCCDWTHAPSMFYCLYCVPPSSCVSCYAARVRHSTSGPERKELLPVQESRRCFGYRYPASSRIPPSCICICVYKYFNIPLCVHQFLLFLVLYSENVFSSFPNNLNKKEISFFKMFSLHQIHLKLYQFIN